ncbi:vacuolar protein sorting/targeting protein PEP1 [Aspergillus tanneri]|uniref:Vacuolar protein sorting/targeting protein 10 n=1 Tax=Aspergillus tanneri TaxID=1220188 RepID=A0A5M9MD77_9EURO|nr:vacuolar protein sorting/targeting protein PEP1 [Aspergillus tanneri]KAA8644881.1 vacuolar protein sorting/targeting protein PEP1 [Aspergillus tanneri]
MPDSLSMTSQSNSASRSIFPKGPSFTLEDFSNRDFIVKEFIETLSDSVAFSRRSALGPSGGNQLFDPKPLIRTFEHAQQQLSELSSDLEIRENELSAAARRAEAQHSQNVNTLGRKLKQTISSFQQLDTSLNGAGTHIIGCERTGATGNMAVETGRKLEELDRQRRRALDAYFLLQCWEGVSNRGEITLLENLRRSGTGEAKVRSAQIARQLLRISQRLDPHSWNESKGAGSKSYGNGPTEESANGEGDSARRNTREIIEKFSETLEKDLLKQFDDFYRKANFEGMKDCATVLQDFNGGASVIALFVNQHQFFIDRSQLVTEEVAGDTEAWEKLADPDAEPVKVEPSLQSLIDEVKVVVQEESAIIRRAFPYYEQVLGKFLQRVFQQSIQQRLEMALEKANDISPLAFLRSLQSSRNYISALVDDLKSHGLTENPDPISAQTALVLDQQLEDLFVPYFVGSSYIEREKKTLEELYTSILFRFTTFHSRRKKAVTTFMASLSKSGTELLTSARDTYISRLESSEFSATHRRILLQVAGLRESNDVLRPTDVKLVEEDGLPSIAYAKRMLKWLAEGVGRSLELSITSETPKDMLALLSLLLSMMGEGYIEVCLDAALEAATSQESGKMEPDFAYLAAVRGAIGITNLMVMCINTLLIPLAAGSITVRKEMEKKTSLITVRIEEKVNAVERKTIDATLIGTNLRQLLTDVALGLRSLLLEHFKRFSVNGPGGLMVTKDMTQYTNLLKSWDVDEQAKAPGGALDVLLEVGSLFVIGSEALRERVRGGTASAAGARSGSNTTGSTRNPGVTGSTEAGLSIQEVRAYVSRREDSNTPAMQNVLNFLVYFKNTTTSSAAKNSKKPKITATNLDSQPTSLFYFEDAETALLNTRDGNLLQTFDGGESWEVVKGEDGGMEHKVLFIWQHPFDKNKAYAISQNKRHWVTTDQAKTWASFEVQGVPAVRHYPLVFHGRNSSKVIFQTEECAGRYCIVKSHYTTDDFNTVKPLRESIGGCAWAVGHPQFAENLDIAREIEDRSLCVVPGLKVPLPHANRLIYSDDYFNSDIEGSEVMLQGRPVSGVISTAAVKRFIVAAVKSQGTEELALYVTIDSKLWHRAEFEGHRIQEDAYTILESTNYSLQVDVLPSPMHGMGVLFTSNSEGTYFTRNIEHTNRDVEGTVDFEKIANIQGVVLVNIVKNPEQIKSASDKKLISKISFDDGRTFQPLKVGDEDLHLHSVTASANIGRVFSSPAPGLVMGVGNTGEHLGKYPEGNLYVSDDAGMTWRYALKGPHKYEFGDQGAIVVAVSEDERNSEIKFSVDHGKVWESAYLGDGLYPEMVTTTPDSTSLKFTLVCSSKQGKKDGHAIYSVDFGGLHERKCEENDFEEWAARLDENREPDCLMGHKQFFRRRKANADCFVDEKFRDPQPIFKPCKCTAKDFECEYKPSEDGKGCSLSVPLRNPEEKCKKPTDTFLGRSGWRLIPGNACIRDGGENLDKEIERPCNETHNTPTGDIISTRKDFNARKFAAYYYMERQSSNSGHDETVFVLTTENDLYVSHDHGKTWERALKGEKISKIFLHPYNSDAAFFLGDGKEGFWTSNRGDTFNPFKAPSLPTREPFLSPITFHPRYNDWLIWTGAVDCDHGDCHSDAYISRNRGADWQLLLRYVQKCEFENREDRPESEELIFCEQFENENKNNRLQLLSTNKVFSDWKVHFEDVINYATMSEFIVVASRSPENPESLVASTSIDGQVFAEAQFPHNVQVPVQTAYTVLESSTHAVFLHVTVSSVEGAEYGPIIKSNSNGTSFVLSLNAVNRNDKGFADFEKMQGLEGVAIVNVVSNADAVSKGSAMKKLKTMITHNDGAQWMFLPPPARDADGNEFNCSVTDGKGTDDCSLHLHGYTERKDERDTFSSGSAIGLMMGVGNVGDHLAGGDEVDTFITKDGGITWKSAKKGRFMWEYGDSGSVIVIVPESRPTKSLYYSVDEGDSWEEFSFSDVDVQIDDISTVPSDTSKNFLLWGRDLKESSRHGLITVNIDFSGLRSRSCNLTDDYAIWEPKHPFQKDNCLFGHVERYYRKKPSARCWNDWREPHIHSIGMNCSCTRADYECDYNYEPQADGSCALVPGLPKPDAMAICKAEPARIEYWEPTGYRRIPQTTCEGGKNLDHVISKPCPSKEEEYEKRHGISGVGLFFAIVTPVAVAGAAGYFIYTRWDGKFGQIRLGENVDTSQGLLSRDSLIVRVPIAIIAGVVAVSRALPLLVASLWRSAAGYVGFGRYRHYSRPYASRGSFAARRGDYTSVVDDEDELLGVEDAEAEEGDEP